MWAGVDVGGARKGFHAAVVDDERVVAGPTGLADARTVVEWLRPHEPIVVAVDSPVCAAAEGSLSREGERALARDVCGIRYTPEEPRLEGGYYEWIRNGFSLYRELEAAREELYRELEADRLEVIECFPTASWTRWAGPKGTEPQAEWSSRALADLGVADVPPRLSQDGRDAIAAAVTARLYSVGRVQRFGGIVVPLRGKERPSRPGAVPAGPA